ncbi:hypothetical protein GEMRC1_004522 [Eukaryota sp. GEM-RC1]
MSADCNTLEILTFLRSNVHSSHNLAFLPLFVFHRLPVFHWIQTRHLARVLHLPSGFQRGCCIRFATLYKTTYPSSIFRIFCSKKEYFPTVPETLSMSLDRFPTQSVDDFILRIYCSVPYNFLSSELLLRWFLKNFDSADPQLLLLPKRNPLI